MNLEPVGKTECAPIAAGSVSKRDSESCSEEESSRKIPKLSETTSHAKLQVAVLSNIPTADHDVMLNDPDVYDEEDSDDEYSEVRAQWIKDEEIMKNAILQIDPKIIDAKDSTGKTALHRAAKGGHGEIVKMLLDKGANPDLQDENGLTPLHYMLCNSSWGTGIYENEIFQEDLDDRYVRVMKELLAAGADAHLQDKKDRTPLHTALRADNNIGAEMIVDARGGNNVQDKEGRTPLHLAMKQHWLEIAKKLLTAGVSTRIRDNRGKTPLHIAIDWRDNSIANNFVEADAENDLQDELGQTPLHFGARHGHVLATRMLLYCGAHPHLKAKDNEDYSWSHFEQVPLGLALKNRKRAISEMILAACVLQGIVVDWEKDFNWEEDLFFMARENTYTIEYYQDLCVDLDLEVQKMKNAKIFGTTVSYYDFARKHERKLAPYLKNKDICAVLRSINLDDHFPNYGGLITFKIKRARKRNTLIASCLKCFSILSKKFPSLLKVNTDSILDFLNERDMLNFVAAFNISNVYSRKKKGPIYYI